MKTLDEMEFSTDSKQSEVFIMTTQPFWLHSPRMCDAAYVAQIYTFVFK